MTSLEALIKDMEAHTSTVKFSPAMRSRLQYNLCVLINSCREGYDGTWDVSTADGKDAFLDMIDILRETGRLLDLDTSQAKDPESVLA